ncbi:MAG: hypothetical protein JXA90_03225 [Planctomycetes bacterium]|nr:hypothetical protein [Planctomycetota bacterium]
MSQHNGTSSGNGRGGILIPPPPPPPPAAGPDLRLVLELVEAAEALLGGGERGEGTEPSAREWSRRYRRLGRAAKAVREAIR